MKNLLLYFLFLFPISTYAQKVDLSSSPFESKVDELVKKYQDLDIFSGVVLIADGEKIAYHKAFGMANREKGQPNTTETLFDIGSMNKTFTSIVVHQLIEEGKLSLDDKLTEYIKGYEDPNANKITVEHLLNHSSGFGDYHRGEYWTWETSKKTIDNITNLGKKFRIEFEPGTDNMYSNYGYVVLGAIIEKVTGDTYHNQVQKRVLDRIGLKDTYVQNLEKVRHRQGIGYYWTPLGEMDTNDTSREQPNPDGGFLATTKDVLKFYRSFILDDKLLSENAKSNHEFFQMWDEIPDGKAPSFAGGFPGWNSMMFFVKGLDISIIVFANMDEPVAEHVAYGILQLTRGQKPNEPVLPAMQRVRLAYEDHGTEYVKENWADLIVNFHPMDPHDIILNDLGYAYLYARGDTDSAIELFQLNVEMFPDVANCYDSLGEAYKVAGMRSKAIESYKKALEIRPDLESAQKALKELYEK